MTISIRNSFQKKFMLFIFLAVLRSFCFSQQPALIKDIVPGETRSDGPGWTYPTKMAVLNDKVLFWADDGIHGSELWSTNGTAEGTNMVMDITPGSEGSGGYAFSFFKQAGNGLYFGITQGGSVRQIWFTDGTNNNTKLLFQVDPIVSFDNFSEQNSVVFNNDLYMLAYRYDSQGWHSCVYKLSSNNDPVIFYECAYTTESIGDITVFQGNIVISGYLGVSAQPGIYAISGQSASLICSGNFSPIVNVNDQYLALTDAGYTGSLYCIYSTTPASPTLLNTTGGDILNIGSNQGPIITANKLFYLGNDQGLWVTDGTSSGTIKANIDFTNMNYFGKETRSALFQLSTANGTRAIKWDGASAGFEEYTTNTLVMSEYLHKAFLYGGSRNVLVTGAGVYIRMGDDLHTYKVIGNMDGSSMSFSWLATYVHNVVFNDHLLCYAINGTNNLGFEPYKFLLNIKLWTGDVSSDWFDPSNWSPSGVPTCIDDVLIPKTPTGRYPVINADASCRGLNVNFGSVTVNAGYQLTYFGQLSNYGSITGNAVSGSMTVYYEDADHDGHGNPLMSVEACSSPSGYVTTGDDCDDNDNTVYPGAAELCDNKDNDCDGIIDEGLTKYTYYVDADGDGFGENSSGTSLLSCSLTAPVGFSSNNLDCNDNDNTIYPGATEICDNKDNNCNGSIDEGNVCVTTPSITINDRVVYENEGLVTLTVTLDKPATKTFKINYNTVDVTTTSNQKGRNSGLNDYVSAKGSITIPAGSTSASITITILSDTRVEGDEYFDVVLSLVGATNATLSDDRGRVTIKDPVVALTKLAKEQLIEEKLFSVEAYPNPSHKAFAIHIRSNSMLKVNIKVTDILGRIIEQKDEALLNRNLELGAGYKPGVYFIEVSQGSKRQILKLIRQ